MGNKKSDILYVVYEKMASAFLFRVLVVVLVRYVVVILVRRLFIIILVRHLVMCV